MSSGSPCLRSLNERALSSDHERGQRLGEHVHEGAPQREHVDRREPRDANQGDVATELPVEGGS